MQQREDEPAAHVQDAGNGGEQAVEVIDIGQPVVTGDALETLPSQDGAVRRVGLDIGDAKRLMRFSRLRLGQERCGNIDPGNPRSPAGELQGDPAPDSAGHIEQRPPADLSASSSSAAVATSVTDLPAVAS